MIPRPRPAVGSLIAMALSLAPAAAHAEAPPACALTEVDETLLALTTAEIVREGFRPHLVVVTETESPGCLGAATGPRRSLVPAALRAAQARSGCWLAPVEVPELDSVHWLSPEESDRRFAAEGGSKTRAWHHWLGQRFPEARAILSLSPPGLTAAGDVAVVGYGLTYVVGIEPGAQGFGWPTRLGGSRGVLVLERTAKGWAVSERACQIGT